MKKSTKLVLCIVLIVVAMMALSACSSNNKQKPYDHLVTFNYNVGKMDTNCEDQYLGVMDGKTVAVYPGDESGKITAFTVKGYYLEGWYSAKTDANGKVIIDAETGLVELDEQWDFENNKVTSDITLYANWIIKRVLKYVYVDKVTGEEEVVKEENGVPNETKEEPTSNRLKPQKAGYTLFGYYKDKEMTEKFEWPYVYDKEEGTIYVNFIEGTWVFVSTASEFLNAKDYENIYLLNDIDFSENLVDLKGNTWATKSVSGEINGNGHKLTGIKYAINTVQSTEEVWYGLFGLLGSKAYIHDLTIEDAEFVITIPDKMTIGKQKVGFFAQNALEGAKLEKVTVTGRLTIKRNEQFSLDYSQWIANDKAKADVKDCSYSEVEVIEDKSNIKEENNI